MRESESRNHAIKFRKLFQLETEATPELIWSNSMRENLRSILSVQLQSIVKHSQHIKDFLSDDDMFRHEILNFEFD